MSTDKSVRKNLKKQENSGGIPVKIAKKRNNMIAKRENMKKVSMKKSDDIRKKLTKTEVIINENLENIKTMRAEGYSEAEIWQAIGISKTSADKYKKENTFFRVALENGSENLRAKIEDSLYKLAMGKVKIKKTKTVWKLEDKELREVVETEITEPGPNVKAIQLALIKLDPEVYGTKKANEALFNAINDFVDDKEMSLGKKRSSLFDDEEDLDISRPESIEDVANVDEMRKRLTQIIRGGQSNNPTVIKAVEMLGKLDGLFNNTKDRQKEYGDIIFIDDLDMKAMN